MCITCAHKSQELHAQFSHGTIHTVKTHAYPLLLLKKPNGECQLQPTLSKTKTGSSKFLSTTSAGRATVLLKSLVEKRYSTCMHFFFISCSTTLSLRRFTFLACFFDMKLWQHVRMYVFPLHVTMLPLPTFLPFL